MDARRGDNVRHAAASRICAVGEIAGGVNGLNVGLGAAAGDVAKGGVKASDVA